MITERKAGNAIKAGKGVIAFSPRHPELRSGDTGIVYLNESGATKRLADFCATYADVDPSQGRIVRVLRTAKMVREIVPDNDGRGLCRMTTSMVQRYRYEDIA